MGNRDKIQIKMLDRAEYCSIADEVFDVHEQSLPSDVMPKFGSGYHRRYMLLLLGGQGNVFVAFLRGETIGFLTSVDGSPARRIVPSPADTLCFLKSCSRQPVLLLRLLRQLIKRVQAVPDSSEIQFFAVRDEFRGRGVGRALLQEAQKKAILSGVKVMLTKTNNLDLVRFYQQNQNAEVRNVLKVSGTTYYYVGWPLRQ